MTTQYARRLAIAMLFAIITSVALPAFAADEPVLNSGDTAWMLVSSLLVLMMTLPGLALFYGGLVKKDNVLATLMQTFVVCAAVSVVWPMLGHTLAFSEGGFVGNLDKFMMKGITPTALSGTIPESVFLVFQMTFAIITTALLVGAVADRIKFNTLLVFSPLWVLIVYAPIAHWVWGPGGFLGGLGVEGFTGLLGYGAALDFAGGTVVHINSGVAGLVAAIFVGRSLKEGRDPSTSNNLVMSVIGTGLLWVGWFGFNAGSALTAGTVAGYAMLVTHSSTGMAALVWIFVEMAHKKKASVQGALSGAVVGLVAITPAAGFVDFAGSLWIGGIAGVVCYYAVTYLKGWLKYDDALDVFGIHGVGGIIGALLTGVFANPSVNAAATGLLYGNPHQLIAQILAVGVVAAYSAVATYIILRMMKLFMRVRVNAHVERTGLDMALHGETLKV